MKLKIFSILVFLILTIRSCRSGSDTSSSSSDSSSSSGESSSSSSESSSSSGDSSSSSSESVESDSYSSTYLVSSVTKTKYTSGNTDSGTTYTDTNTGINNGNTDSGTTYSDTNTGINNGNMDTGTIYGDTNTGTTYGETNSFSTNIMSYSKCNPLIVAEIHKLWQELYGGAPKDLIETRIKHGEEILIGTTPCYYSDDLKCLSSSLHSNFVTTRSVYSNGSCILEGFLLSECGGRAVLASKGFVLYQYHVIQEKGVIGSYTCLESGADPKADDKPDGEIIISANNFKPEAVDKCFHYMKNLGIPITVNYPYTCNCTEIE